MNKDNLDYIIEKSFRSEPEFHLSIDFAQKVTSTIVRREQWKSDVLEYLIISAVLFSLVVLVVLFYYFIDKEFISKLLFFIAGNAIPVISVGLILNFILFADRVLLRLLFRRSRLSA